MVYFRAASRRLPRQGYTLLELVLAAGLSALVMAGVSAVVMLIYQVQQTSDDRITTVTLGRNLLRQLEWDLQAIPGVMPEAAVADSSSLDTSSELETAGGGASSSVSTTTDMTGLSSWFSGDSVSLEFIAEPVRRTGRQFAAGVDIESEEALQQTRRRLIRWGVTDAKTLNLPFAGEAAESGLVRAEALTDTTATETTFLEALPVAEVISLEFSYFDGSSWLSEWDSETAGGLPLAVEAVLTLQQGAIDPETGRSAQEWTTRRVFNIPTQRFLATTLE